MMRPRAAVVLLSALIFATACRQDSPEARSAAEPELLAAIAHNEGVAVNADGVLYFSEMATRTIVGFAPGKGLFNFREDSNRASGLAFDNQGRLVACEVSTPSRKEPRVTRTEMATGEVEILATGFEGQPFNGPNGVTVDSRDRIYFTDPGSSVPSSVYRIDLDGSLSRIVSVPDIEWPNGVVVSPNDRTLYVGESGSAEEGNRLIRAYELSTDGSVSNMRVVYRYEGPHGPDGMSVDVAGNLYVAAGSNLNWRKGHQAGPPPGIHVISPDGEVLGNQPVYEDYITDCAFGGPDMKTLYITAGKSLFSVRTEIAGTRR
jgi:gluconolactonase